MSPITTHVLDTSAGRPAAGIGVTLHERAGDGWREVGGGVTDADGRVGDLLPGGAELNEGVYRLTFDLGAHHPDGFYPEVQITFAVRSTVEHYHVPLLLNPYGYTTYRGS